MTGRTLLEALDHWSKIQPDKLLHTFLDDYGTEVDTLTYKGLLDKSASLAKHLLAPAGQKGAGLNPGDRALLVYLPSLDFIIAFYACLRAGIIAVPVFPPDVRKAKKDLYMFSAIQRSSGALVALTNKTFDYAKKLSGVQAIFSKDSGNGAWPDIKWVVTDSIIQASVGDQDFEFSSPTLDTPAFLQFTSGSTSEPKGVIVTHGNLAHNLELMVTGVRASETTVQVSWLPLYHDMGLIGSYLGLLYSGGTGVYMSPVSFVRNPPLWMETMSKYRGTHASAPNFAYGLTARKFLAKRPQPTLDLSCVEHLINAAEPIHWIDVEHFYAVFEQAGLKRGVIFPTYGLAEHTLFVCSNGKQVMTVNKKILESEQRVVEVEDTDPNAYEVVGCGYPGQAEGVDLKIVRQKDADPADSAQGAVGDAMDEDLVGEIWVRSRSRALGYWGLEEKTAEDFGGHLAIKEDEGFLQIELPLSSMGFLRTGDLGFMHKEELFICGRMKDLIIIRGRNIFPQDIERAVEDAFVGKLRGGCSAAFAVTTNDGTESLHLVAEVSEGFQQESAGALADEMRSTIAKGQGVSLSGVYLLKPRTVEKTTSGKIARQWCKRALKSGTLQTIFEWFDDSATEDLPTSETSQPKSSESTTSQPTMNVDEMSDSDILNAIVETVAVDVLKTTTDTIMDNVGKPIISLGLNSMEGMQMLTLLEGKLGTTIPQEILFEEETTLENLIPVIRSGGKIEARTTRIDLAELCAKGKAKTDKQRKEWVNLVSTKSSWRTGEMPRAARVDISKDDEKAAVRVLTFAFTIGPLWEPALTAVVTLLVVALVYALPFGNLLYALGASIIGFIAGISVVGYVKKMMYQEARRLRWRRALLEFFSCKLILNTDLDPNAKYLIISDSLSTNQKTSQPSSEAFSWAAASMRCVAHVVVGSMHYAATGFTPVLLSQNENRIALDQLESLIGETETDNAAEPWRAPGEKQIKPSADTSGARKILRSGRSVIWDRADAPDLSDLVDLAMTTGAQLLPCATIAEDVNGSRSQTLTVVYGEPILVPHTSKPHKSLTKGFTDTLREQLGNFNEKFSKSYQI